MISTTERICLNTLGKIKDIAEDKNLDGFQKEIRIKKILEKFYAEQG